MSDQPSQQKDWTKHPVVVILGILISAVAAGGTVLGIVLSRSSPASSQTQSAPDGLPSSTSNHDGPATTSAAPPATTAPPQDAAGGVDTTPPSQLAPPPASTTHLTITIKLDCNRAGPNTCSGAGKTPKAEEGYHAIVTDGSGQWIYSDQCFSHHKVDNVETGVDVIDYSAECNSGEPLFKLDVGHYRITEVATMGSASTTVVSDLYVVT